MQINMDVRHPAIGHTPNSENAGEEDYMRILKNRCLAEPSLDGLPELKGKVWIAPKVKTLSQNYAVLM